MKLKTKFADSDFSFGEIVNARIGTVEGALMVAMETKEGNSVEFDFKSIKEFLRYFEDAPQEQKTWAEKVKIRELPSGLKIADLDYYIIDENGKKKTEFTWGEAMERFKEDPNWRLPTPKELNQMVLDLGYNDEGVFEGELFVKNLGEDSLEAYKEHDGYGNYWYSTPNSSANARYLYFSSTYVSPQYSFNRPIGLTVRCVRRTIND